MAKKSEGLDVVLGKFRGNLETLIADLVSERVADIFSSLQGTGKKKRAEGKRARTNPTKARETILSTLQKEGRPMGMGAIREATGLKQSTASAALKALLASQEINKTGEKRATVYFTGEKKPKAPARPKKPDGKRKAKG